MPAGDGELVAFEPSQSMRSASGVLAVVIASPCTAPFMGAALGYALGAPPQVTLAIFVALGVGMALPYLALAWFPAWRRALPRPGPWMLRLKQLLAFPLYATVVWLVWVLGAQLDNDAVLRAGALLVVVAFALWAWRSYRGGGARAWSAVAVLGALAGFAIAWPLLTGRVPEPPSTAQPPRRVGGQASIEGQWQPYSEARVADLTDQGRHGVRRFHRGLVRHLPGEQALRAQEPGRARRVRAASASCSCAPTGPAATRRSRARSPRWGAAASRSTCSIGKGRPPQLLPEILQKQTVLDALASP